MRRLNLVLSALVLVAALATVLLLVFRPDDAEGGKPASSGTQPAVNDDGSYTVGSQPSGSAHDAVVACTDGAAAALSYDYRKLDEGLAAATALMTDDFASEFSGTFDATARPLAKRQKAVTQSLVRAAGLVREDGDSAVCLAFVDQVLVSSETMQDKASPTDVTQSRVVISLEHDGSDWLVSGMSPI